MHQPDDGLKELMSLEDMLLEETKKWLVRAEDLFAAIRGDEHFQENISAYIQDSRYFMQNGDLIRAFEAVVWAWAWMEIGLEQGLLEERVKDKDDR